MVTYGVNLTPKVTSKVSTPVGFYSSPAMKQQPNVSSTTTTSTTSKPVVLAAGTSKGPSNVEIKYYRADGTPIYGKVGVNVPIPTTTPIRPQLVTDKSATKVVNGRTIKITRPDAYYEKRNIQDLRSPEAKLRSLQFFSGGGEVGARKAALEQEVAERQWRREIGQPESGPLKGTYNVGAGLGDVRYTDDQARALGYLPPIAKPVSKPSKPYGYSVSDYKKMQAASVSPLAGLKEGAGISSDIPSVPSFVNLVNQKESTILGESRASEDWWKPSTGTLAGQNEETLGFDINKIKTPKTGVQSFMSGVSGIFLTDKQKQETAISTQKLSELDTEIKIKNEEARIVEIKRQKELEAVNIEDIKEKIGGTQPTVTYSELVSKPMIQSVMATGGITATTPAFTAVGETTSLPYKYMGLAGASSYPKEYVDKGEKLLKEKEILANEYANFLTDKKYQDLRSGQVNTIIQANNEEQQKFIDTKLEPLNKKQETFNTEYKQYLTPTDVNNDGIIDKTTVNWNQVPSNIRNKMQTDISVLNTEWKSIEPEYNKMLELSKENEEYQNIAENYKNKLQELNNKSLVFQSKMEDQSNVIALKAAYNEKKIDETKNLIKGGKKVAQTSRMVDYESKLTPIQLGKYYARQEIPAGTEGMVEVSLPVLGYTGGYVVYKNPKTGEPEFVRGNVKLSKGEAEKRIMEETGAKYVTWTTDNEPVLGYSTSTHEGIRKVMDVYYGKKATMKEKALTHQLESEQLISPMESSNIGKRLTNLGERFIYRGADIITEPAVLGTVIGGNVAGAIAGTSAPSVITGLLTKNVLGRNVIIGGTEALNVGLRSSKLTKEEKELMEQGENLLGAQRYVETKARDWLNKNRQEHPISGGFKDWIYETGGAQTLGEKYIPQKVIEDAFKEYYKGEGYNKNQINILTKAALKVRLYGGASEAVGSLSNEVYSEMLAGKALGQVFYGNQVRAVDKAVDAATIQGTRQLTRAGRQKIVTDITKKLSKSEPWEAFKIVGAYGAGEAYGGSEINRIIRGGGAEYDIVTGENGMSRRVYSNKQLDKQLGINMLTGYGMAGITAGIQRKGAMKRMRAVTPSERRTALLLEKGALNVAYTMDFPYEAAGDLTAAVIEKIPGVKKLGMKGTLGVITRAPVWTPSFTSTQATSQFATKTEQESWNKYINPPEYQTQFKDYFKGKKGQVALSIGGTSEIGDWTGMGGTNIGTETNIFTGVPAEVKEEGKSLEKITPESFQPVKIHKGIGVQSAIKTAIGAPTSTSTSTTTSTSTAISALTGVPTSTSITSSTSTSTPTTTMTSTNINTIVGTPTAFGGTFIPGSLTNKGVGGRGGKRGTQSWVVINPLKYLAGEYFARQQAKVMATEAKFKNPMDKIKSLI